MSESGLSPVFFLYFSKQAQLAFSKQCLYMFLLTSATLEDVTFKPYLGLEKKTGKVVGNKNKSIIFLSLPRV